MRYKISWVKSVEIDSDSEEGAIEMAMRVISSDGILTVTKKS